jgi:hypothetical protein
MFLFSQPILYLVIEVEVLAKNWLAIGPIEAQDSVRLVVEVDAVEAAFRISLIETQNLGHYREHFRMVWRQDTNRIPVQSMNLNTGPVRLANQAGPTLRFFERALDRFPLRRQSVANLHEEIANFISPNIVQELSARRSIIE